MRGQRLERLAALAGKQHGVVTHRQLVALGFGEDAIQYQLATARLHRIHRGVYAVGHRKLTIRGHWMGAVLALGDNAVLSHLSAAALWGVLAIPGGAIDVLVETCGARRRKGIKVHETLHLPHATARSGTPSR